jgi:carbonic anhydrase/acetyltransferase-like protein (isoleucine patch superfamily)
MAIYRLGDWTPDIHPEAWVADSATVIGKVYLGPQASVWFNVSIRADNERIVIGARSNVQEGSVLHVDDGFPMEIAEDVTVGHMVMLHGCRIGAGSLIGIQSVVLNGAQIGRECLIGAGALVTEGKVIPDRSLVLGSPGKVVRQLTDDDIARMRRGVQIYVDHSSHYRQHLQRIA